MPGCLWGAVNAKSLARITHAFKPGTIHEHTGRTSRRIWSCNAADACNVVPPSCSSLVRRQRAGKMMTAFTRRLACKRGTHLPIMRAFSPCATAASPSFEQPSGNTDRQLVSLFAAATFGVVSSICLDTADCDAESTKPDAPPMRLPRQNVNRLNASYKRLGTVLGEGAYGIVEMGRHIGSGDLVAIKSVTCHDPHERDALERELVALEWVLSHGGHPGLLHLMDIYRGDSRTTLIVSELCPGGELFDKLINEGPMSETEAARLTRSIADALHFLHDTCGWVHGDMKPENVMLNSDEHRPVTLVDLGSAHPSHSKPNRAQVGTTAYWSPESFSSSNYAGGTKSDMFATGILLYIMLYGVHPFDPDGTLSDEEIASRIENCDWHFLDDGADDGMGSTIPKLSEGAKRVISELLERNPERRMDAKTLSNDPWLSDTQSSNEAFSKAKPIVVDEVLTSSSSKVGTVQEDEGAQRRNITLRRHSKKILMLQELVKNAPDDGGRISNDATLARIDVGQEDDSLPWSWVGTDAGKILSSIDRVQHPANTVIIEEGDTSDSSWYLLLDGLVQVELADPLTGLPLVAAQLRQGSFFGEGSALEPGKPREATIRSLTKVDLMKLKGTDLQRILKIENSDPGDPTNSYCGPVGPETGDADPSYFSSIAQRRALIRLRTLLQHSNDAEKEALHLEPGEILFEEGDPADCVYLVVGGRLNILLPDDAGGDTSSDNTERNCVELNAGDLLGETAVMTGQPRNATIVAAGEGATLTKISRQQFIHILGSNKGMAQTVREFKIASFSRTSRKQSK